ncbi:caspase family protein [uncultured Bacteroides sp.]|uniref:caspase family protein n=1 Tax=uncultured Bacteroides sp. TaxID=162156 RepID=UPI002AAB2CD1|nr:caspase family protein [uncultured Bacteroides sp.]
MRRIIFLLAIGISLVAYPQNKHQNKSVAVVNPKVIQNQLKTKYSLVEYHTDCGGWYLIGQQVGTSNQYGFCDKTGRKIAFGASEYKIHKGFIELCMVDTEIKEEFKKELKEYQIYQQKYNEYSNKVNTISEPKRLKAEEEEKKTNPYFTNLFDTKYEKEAKLELLKRGIEEPIKPSGSGRFNISWSDPEKYSKEEWEKWKQYTYIQPQPFEKIDFNAIANSDNLCNVQKNGLYGVADASLRLIIPCQYNEEVISTTADNYVITKIHGKYGLISKSGNILLNNEYSSIDKEGEFLKVTKDGKYGLCDASTGKEILPCLFQDVTFALKGEQNFTHFAQSYVEKSINEWQKKGEFEKTELWQQRVNENTRKQKILELTKSAQSAYISLYASKLDDELILDKYDPDHETYLIKSKIGGRMLVPVPMAQAPTFKDKFASCTKTPRYFIQNDHIGIAQYDFKLSNAEVYKFSNQASLNYSVAQVEYNFDPISITTSNLNNGQSEQKQTISTIELSAGKSDVDVNIPFSSSKNEKTFAIIFSNENYQNEQKVDFANNDGRVFREYCLKTLGLPADNVHFRPDATFNNFRTELNWIKQVSEAYHNDANIIIYYAGHGVPDEASKEAYLLPVDGVSSDVSTGYSLNELYKFFGQIHAKNVYCFLDACFSGAKRDGGMLAANRGVSIKPKTDIPQGNMVVFSASTNQETAYPYKQKGHGLFTYFLLKKLQDTKGAVTLGDLSNYVTTNVSQQSIVINRKSQTPTVIPSVTVSDGWKGMMLK